MDTRQGHRGDLLTVNIDHLEKTTAAARVPHSHRQGGGGGRSGVCLCVSGGGGEGVRKKTNTQTVMRLGAETKQTNTQSDQANIQTVSNTPDWGNFQDTPRNPYGLDRTHRYHIELNRTVSLVCAKSRILFFQTDDDICPKGLH